MTFGYQRCTYCGEEYQPYTIEPFETQIKDCDVICKKCLNVMVGENYKEAKPCVQEETEK